MYDELKDLLPDGWDELDFNNALYDMEEIE
jgi:hypothetical protein